MSIGDGVGVRIQQAREVKRISASQLAREVGVTPTAVWNWEQNQIAPRSGTLTKVAARLGVSEDFLRTGRMDAEATASRETEAQSIAQMVEETRTKIAHVTGFTLDRVKLHLEFVAD